MIGETPPKVARPSRGRPRLCPGRGEGHTGGTMTNRSAPRRHLSTSPFAAPADPVITEFAVGDRVSHDRHGLGKIIGQEPTGALLVDFGAIQVRVLSPFKGMHKL